MLRCLNHLSNTKNTLFCKVGSCTDLLCAKVWEEKKKTLTKAQCDTRENKNLIETHLAFSAAKEADEETSFKEDALSTFSQCVRPDLNSGVSETL